MLQVNTSLDKKDLLNFSGLLIFAFQFFSHAVD